MRPLLLIALLWIAGCEALPADAGIVSVRSSAPADLDAPAAMLHADFDRHDIIDVSRTAIDVLPGKNVPTLDENRLADYRARLSRLGLRSVPMAPFGSPQERHPTFVLATRGFSGNFTQRGILKAERCPNGVANDYDDQRFESLGSGWCAFTWHSP